MRFIQKLNIIHKIMKDILKNISKKRIELMYLIY